MANAELAYQVWLAQLAVYRSRLQVLELFLLCERMELVLESSREVGHA
ncbi:MAG: hypothetical protein ACK40N_13900 [Meiothermus ruber]|nr:hypothetical protein [Meiothermus sp.]GIW25756.1 MAG: hypothetical protein KatS3mg069_2023 [Meiothermus sp.]